MNRDMIFSHSQVAHRFGFKPQVFRLAPADPSR
jgi:hypothetical protein